MDKIYRPNKPNNGDVEFIINQHAITYPICEDNNFIPRFSLDDLEIFDDIPVNEPLRYSSDLIIKAVKYGLVFLINYKGSKDKNFAGHERVIYPLVLGKSTKGKELLRGYHLSGWSVSQNNNITKVWRMFRTDRILSMTFTGSFFRLAPEGYNMDDKGMRGGIIAHADFKEIRKNQEDLVRQQKIQDRDEVSITKEPEEKEKEETPTIRIENTDTILDLKEFLDNPKVAAIDDLDNLRVSFMKSVFGNKFIAVLGALGKPGNVVKVKTKKANKGGNYFPKKLGSFKVLSSGIGRELKKIKSVKGNTLYDLYVFVEKE